MISDGNCCSSRDRIQRGLGGAIPIRDRRTRINTLLDWTITDVNPAVVACNNYSSLPDYEFATYTTSSRRLSIPRARVQGEFCLRTTSGQANLNSLKKAGDNLRRFSDIFLADLFVSHHSDRVPVTEQQAVIFAKLLKLAVVVMG